MITTYKCTQMFTKLEINYRKIKQKCEIEKLERIQANQLKTFYNIPGWSKIQLHLNTYV